MRTTSSWFLTSPLMAIALPPGSLDLGDQLIGRLTPARIIDRDAIAFASSGACNRSANAAAAAGYEDDAVGHAGTGFLASNARAAAGSMRPS